MIAAWDLSSQRPSFARICADGLIHELDFADNKHTEFLLPNLEAQLQICQEPLTALATVVGPGSFTGIRSGIASMLGFRIARGTKLFGFNKFELMALAAQGRDGIYLVPAGRNECYLQRRLNGRWLESPELMASVKIPADAPRFGLEALEPEHERLEGSYAALCLTAIRAGAQPDCHAIRPLYVRAPDAKTQQSLIERLLSSQT